MTVRIYVKVRKKILGDPRVTTPFLRNVGTDITTIDRIVSEHRMEVIQGTHKGARYAVFLGKEVVGTVNMAYDPAVKRASIGYAIAPRYQGRGLATEAAELLIRAILDNFEIVDIRALIDGKNLASLAVIMKLGFSSEAETAEKYPGYFYYYLYPQNFPLK